MRVKIEKVRLKLLHWLPNQRYQKLKIQYHMGNETYPWLEVSGGKQMTIAVNINPESDHLIDKQETIQDKGHVFKLLHTSGLVPPQGKMIADRLDGIWVSSGGALMSRPRARLGVMAYWVVLHLWVLGTLL